MSSIEMLRAKAQEYLSEDTVECIDQAYAFAQKAHSGQTRKSGEPFVQHPLQTAIYLAELRLDGNTLAAALLHDVMEDCDVEFDELEGHFGQEVAKLVDGVTKLTKHEILADGHRHNLSGSSGNDLAQAASLRKMLMSMAEDIRVVLIKLADRLHNMRTLNALPKDRRLVIARETMEIYAPLAHRLGIWEIKWRLEDLSFQHLNADAYRNISKLLNKKRTEREEYIEAVRRSLEEDLNSARIEAEVTGRPKNIYSIYKKMEKYTTEKNIDAEIYDLFALRVLVNEVADCYSALGIIHSKWRPLPGQFDDYIANPKDNLYESLHTAVVCENASPVEIQIRTHEMHHLAEYGVAAHWLYKEGEVDDPYFEEKMAWLRQLLDWQRDVSGAQEFVESFKTDIFKNQVYVYTPMGEIKELPAGSTPLDFAYRIHTDIGHRCIGAKVNGKLVSLPYELKNGDTVEIITSKTVRGPNLDWLNPNPGHVRTASAREKIRQWFNRQTRKTNIQSGRDIFHKQLRRLTTSIDNLEVAKLMEFNTVEEFFAALGSGSIATTQVVSKLISQEIKPEAQLETRLPSYGPASGIEVIGVGDLITNIARCCNPIHGDGIIGYITRSRGVSVHRKTCPNVLSAVDEERLVDVGWGFTETFYPVRLRVQAWDRLGLLRDVTSLVSEESVNIASCVSEEEDDLSLISLTVYVRGIDQLDRLCSKLEGVDGVVQVTRVKSEQVNLMV